MTWFTHINRNVIDSNRKHGKDDPPITIRHGKSGQPRYGSSVVLPAESRIVYDPDGRILPCGARLVIVSNEEPKIVE